MSARCLKCRGPFNRATSENKLYCLKCVTPEEELPSWKKDLKKVKGKK